MVERDLFIAPLVFIIIIGLAYLIRPLVTYEENQKFYFPALILKLIAAISLGALYQFYYGGGDTFGYYTYGAAKVYDAFFEDPFLAMKLIFGSNDYSDGTYAYASRILMYPDDASYMVVRFASILSILSGGTYAGTAMLFGLISFTGLWAMYMKFSKLFPNYVFGLAIAILFIPSTIFWGSGLLKDSITYGLLGWSTAALISLLYSHRRPWLWALILVFSMFFAFKIKEYIVLSFIPAAMIWAYFVVIRQMKNKMIRILIAPAVVAVMVALAYYTVYKVGESSAKYSLDNIAQTARITAYDIGRWTGRNSGSRYDLGNFDGSYISMLRLAPAAINVSLFRPYLWEVTNPLMLLAALESFFLMVISIIILFKMVRYRINILSSPAAWFALVYSMTFAFGVGISTYNFGTLFRYKVPLMPFFAILLVLTWESSRLLVQQKRNRGSDLTLQH